MIGARKPAMSPKPLAARSSDRVSPGGGKAAPATKFTLADLPFDVLRVVAAHVRRQPDCCGFECCHRDKKDDGNTVHLPEVPVYSKAARSLAALRRTCSAWFHVANAALQCHVQLVLKTEVTKINGVQSLRVSLAPLRDDVVLAPAGLVVTEPPTFGAADASGVHVVDKLTTSGAAVVLVPDFGKPGERGRRIPIPSMLVTSVSLIEHENLAYLMQIGIGVDMPIDNAAFMALLDCAFQRFPRVAHLTFGQSPVPAPSLSSPLLALRDTLTVLALTSWLPWPATTPPISLPNLRALTCLSFQERDPRDSDGIKSLPITAPKLQELCVGAVRIHPQFFYDFLAPYRATLKNLALKGIVEPTAKDMARMAAGAPGKWVELRELSGSMTALFLMAAGTEFNPMPQLRHIKLGPGEFLGHVAGVRLPALPKLETLETIRFEELQPSMLRDFSLVAPYIKFLDLMKCKLAPAATKMPPPVTVVFPHLEKLMLDRTVLHKSLAATIQAPNVSVLFIDPLDPVAAVLDYPLPATLTTLIIAQLKSHDSVHLRASTIDALPHLSTLQLQTHVKWVGGTLPVLPHVTRFSALVETVDELAQVPHAMPNLVDLEVARTCESCADALRHIPDRPLERLETHVLHPRIMGQIMAMASLKTFGVTLVRLSKADKGAPLNQLDLVYDERSRVLWHVLPRIVPHDSLLAKKLAVKVVNATDVERVKGEIGAAIRALVVTPANKMAGRALRGAVPVEVVVGQNVARDVAKALTAVVRPLTLAGYIRGRVLAEA
ncbi:hypothetical protein GGF32_004644 [Allomyces javanicus]|nr:hypothetical protein GGF32_004644 [Allomyces javanicus]